MKTDTRFLVIFILLCLVISVPTGAEEQVISEEPEAVDVTSESAAIVETLEHFVNLKELLNRDLNKLRKQINAAQSDEERNALVQQLDELRAELKTTTINFENIATDVDLSVVREQKEQKFSLQKELLALLKPVISEMKEVTEDVRYKSELKEQIHSYRQKLPVYQIALENITSLEQETKSKALKRALKEASEKWEKQRTFMQSELQASELELQKILESKASLGEASQSYFKSFVRQRGLYLFLALLVIGGIVIFSRLTKFLMQYLLPGFRAEQHSLWIRLLELLHRITTIIFIILGPMLVFYWVEDWVLFSLSLLLLFGILLTLRQAIPHYWYQFHLFLNIGPVREGERIVLDGLPWKVERIDLYCSLVNPVAEIRQRVPINEFVGLKSRPYDSHEPWFPCKRNDWVILNDGVRGKVTGISPELVRLVERGGATLTYQTSDFLSNSPRNLATNFRIKETLGISYSLQTNSTNEIVDQLHYFVLSRIKEEGYGSDLVNLQVEFEEAADSALNLVVIADFNGSLGGRYNRLRRAMQRWCVDACTKYDWEIPFPQMTFHQANPVAR